MKFPVCILLFAAICCRGTNEEKARAQASGQDGSDYAHAVVIRAESSDEGMKAEKKWLDERIPGYRFCDGSVQKLPDGEELICLTHATNAVGDRVFSIFCVRPPDGAHRTVYFDITAFFGKETRPNQRSDGTSAKAPPSKPSQGAAVPHP